MVDGQILSVEEFTVHHFNSLGYDALVTESTPFHVLFGCLMYPVICDPADAHVRPAMFGDRHAFERGEKGCMVTALLPSDFGTPGYGNRRAKLAAARLNSIGGSQASLIVEFERMLEYSEPLRQYLWAHQTASIDIARKLLAIIPSDRLVAIIQYLFDDYWRNFLGWPDLLVSSPSEYYFVEVKGSGDKLSEEQKRWIESSRQELLLPFKIVKIHRQYVIDRIGSSGHS